MMLTFNVIACLAFVVCGTNSDSSSPAALYEEDYGALKEELYNDEESGENETTQAPVICAKNFSYTYAKNVLNITFVPTFIDNDYTIVLIPENGIAPVSYILPEVKPVQHVIFKRNDIIEYSNYSAKISVHHIKESIPFKFSPLCLRAYKTPFLDCNPWQIGIRLEEDIRKRSITAVFNLSSEFVPCFETFTVELGIFPESDHDKKFCWMDPTVYQRKNVTYSNVMTVTFEDLPANYYCVNVTPRHEDCPRNGDCSTRYSKPGVELKELKEEKLSAIKKEFDATNIIAIIVPSCVVIFIIIIGVTGARKKLIGEYKPANKVSTVRSSSANVFSVDSSNCEKELIVPMLYAQDIDKQQKVVEALHNFLKECCHVTPVIGENNPEVFRDNFAWIQNHFNYKQLTGNTNYKILILETDAAVRLYRHKLSPEGEILQYRHYSHLNDSFLRGLCQLMSSPESLMPNHEHLIVIHFSYFLDSNRIDCFTQKRLYLPYRLVELYNSLWGKSDVPEEREKLLNDWKEKQSYKELLKTTKEMEEFVAKNPDYLNEYVFGSTEEVV